MRYFRVAYTLLELTPHHLLHFLLSLRVHYVPDRFFVANEYDWSKYCKGLLLDNCTSATIGGGKKAVVPMMGLPDGKDGVLVYEVIDYVLVHVICILRSCSSMILLSIG